IASATHPATSAHAAHSAHTGNPDADTAHAASQATSAAITSVLRLHGRREGLDPGRRSEEVLRIVLGPLGNLLRFPGSIILGDGQCVETRCCNEQRERK